MNASRRKQVAKAIHLLAESRNILEIIMSTEQDAFDGLSVTAQEGDKGDVMAEAIATLEEAIAQIESIESDLEPLADAEA